MSADITTPTAVSAVAVVVPVHNEASHLLGCLRHLQAAADFLLRQRPGLSVAMIFVLDRCTDDSAAILCPAASSVPRLVLLHVDHGNVGANRATGVKHGLELCAADGIPVEHVWLASTDADTRVPVDWLSRQLEWAGTGVDAVVGTIEPDRDELGERLFQLWEADYDRGEDHDHIHGANLGVRASSYSAVGGFGSFAAHEDVDLVQRLRRAGFRVKATGTTHAITSGRLTGRAKEGFADYLASLDS